MGSDRVIAPNLLSDPEWFTLKRLPPFCGSGDVDKLQRSPVAFATSRVRQVEHHLQTLCALVWARMLTHFADDADIGNGILDSTIVRAHLYAADAQKRRPASPGACIVGWVCGPKSRENWRGDTPEPKVRLYPSEPSRGS